LAAHCPSGRQAPDYLAEISSHIDARAPEPQAIVIDAGRFFEKSPWKPPAIAKEHLPLIAGINLAKWDPENLRKTLAKLIPGRAFFLAGPAVGI
jgi:hypothetical protein